ncbi:MAG: CHAT domain-containing tetratricopeptide repeat protein [Bacteroidota bacterium]
MKTLSYLILLCTTVHLCGCFGVKNAEKKNSPNKTIGSDLLSEKYYQQGDSLLMAGKFAKAKEQFKSASDLFIKEKEWEKHFRSENKIAECLAEQDSLYSAYILAKQTVKKSSEMFGQNNAEEGVAYNIIGFYFYATGELDTALQYFHKYLNIQKLHYGEFHRNVAEALNNIGAVYQSKGDFTNCISTYRQVIFSIENAVKKDSILLAQTSNNLAVIYFEHGHYDSAWIYFDISLHIRESLIGENHPDIAETYRNIGMAFQRVGDFDKSLSYVEKALSINQYFFGNAHSKVAESHISLGTYHMGIGNYPMALEHYFKSLNIYRKVFGDSHAQVAACYNNIGVAYHRLGQNEKALQYHMQVMSIDSKNATENELDAANNYGNAAAVYDELGMPEKALEYYFKNLEIQLEYFGNTHENVQAIYNNIGLTYLDLEQYNKAFDNLNKALSANQQVWGENHYKTAVAYNNISRAHFNLGEIEQAFNAQEKAINIIEKVDHKDIRLKVGFRNNLGKILFARGDHQAALEQFQLGLYAVLPDEELKKNLYSNPAVDSTSLWLIEVLELLYNKAVVLRDKGFQTNQQEDNMAAINTLSRTVRLLDLLSLSYLEKEDKITLIELSQKIYEEGIKSSKSLLNKKDQIPNAFFFSESYKSKLLLEHIKEDYATHYADIPDSLVIKDEQLKKEIAFLEKTMHKQNYSMNLNQKLLDTRKTRDVLIRYFEKKYPKYYQFKYKTNTPSLAYVQDSLLSSGQALLEYFIGENNIYLFLLKKGAAPQLLEIKKDFPLEEWVEMFQQSLATAKLTKQFIEYGQKLYKKLIAPVSGQLPERVVIVPSGALGYVPFGALLSGPPTDTYNFKTYPFMLEDHQISYCYSATLLMEMKSKKHFKEPKKTFAAFAPTYDGDTTLMASRFAHSPDIPKSFSQLLYAEKEMDRIMENLEEGDVFTGQEATLGSFIEVAQNYRNLHLSMHAWADNRVGDYAFLAFTQQKEKGDDGLLFIRDLYNLQLNADLAVLSACNTATGKLRQSEGIISLARAFAYAGTKSIVTTLWEVNDQSTSELMGYFYKYLTAGKDKDEALRRAQSDYLQREGRSNNNLHPYYWSSFIPVGDMAPIRLTNN